MAEKQPPAENRTLAVGTREPVTGTFISNLFSRLKPGKKPDTEWMSAGDPPAKEAPEGTVARLWDFLFGYNVWRQGRRAGTDGEQTGVTFTQLRALAYNCVYVRTVIESQKDRIAVLPWTFRLKAKPGEKGFETRRRASADPRIAELTEFFQTPDVENTDFQGWVRALLEENLVTDTVTVYGRRNYGGRVFSLDLLDGATIDRKIDRQTGRKPMPPEIAYQQIINGTVAYEFDDTELLYLPQNLRPGRVFGFSKTEQALMILLIALRRTKFQLSSYTEGNIPFGLVQASEGWNAESIERAQLKLDAYLAMPETRSKLIIIPNSGKEPVFPQKEVLKDEFDEWLMRVICHVFGVSPNFFIKQQNRASSEMYWAQADEEGLTPLLAYVKRVIDLALVKWWGYADVEFEWQLHRQIDPVQQADVHAKYINAGVMAPSEVREELGKEPFTPEQEAEIEARRSFGFGFGQGDGEFGDKRAQGGRDRKPGQSGDGEDEDRDDATKAAARRKKKSWYSAGR
jgi:hypothetical protein